jgi:acetyl-CoA acetyltransferase
MPLPREDVDATTPKFLRDKYAVVGVGETAYTRGSNMTTRALATIAVRNAMLDAGLKASEIDGMLSYQSNDSVFSPFVAGDLGIRLNFYMDVFGGGSSTEALIGIAIGVIEAGMCKTVVIFRSMNGFSQVRIGGTGARAAAPVSGDALHSRAYGWQSAGHSHRPLCATCTNSAPPPSRSLMSALPTAITHRTIPKPTTRSASRWRMSSTAA